MKHPTVLAALLFLPLFSGQAAQQPNFDKYHVVPYGSRFGPGILTTGQFGSVLGSYLTPEQWCDAPHQQQPPYPLTVCGVRVRIGSQSAGLMYIGSYGVNTAFAQINFQVPEGVAAEGDVPIQVCVLDSCSDPVPVPFTNKEILLWAEGPAYVHMPLWVKFKVPWNNGFAYPVSPCPWNFGGFQLEVRKDGKTLPTNPAPKCIFPGGPSAIDLKLQASDELPVHLFHVFEEAGEYEIRMSGPLLTPDQTRVARTGYSDWIHVTVGPFSDAKREQWLNTITSTRNEGKAIVSLLADPDDSALRALIKYLPTPVSPLNGSRVILNHGMNLVRDCMAPAALDAFPEPVLKRWISPERLDSVRQMPAYCYWGRN